MGRFAAMAFGGLRVELARVREDLREEDRVLGVVIAREGGAVKDESSLLGNTRLDEVSQEARAAGIRPGQTIASARARRADLRVRVVPLSSVSQALGGLAEMALAFGATTSFEAGGFAGDVVWVDVTGCGHLHASKKDEEGERTLLLRLTACAEKLGYGCRAAMADGPRIAAAVARYAPDAPARPPRPGGEPIVVPRGANAKAIAKLPLVALALEDSTLTWLSALGMRRVADLQMLPRRSLGTRLGADAARVMALIEGDDRVPLTPYVPPETPTEKVELEYGIESAEALLFVAKRLSDLLAARLVGRCLKAARLELALHLDRGVNRGALDRILTVVLASPLARSEDLFAVLKAKIEADTLTTAPILGVALRATEVTEASAQALDLLTPEAKADRALPRLASELSAELGHAAVGTLALRDTWVMADRSRLVPFGLTRKAPPRFSAFLSGGAEPTRWLEEPFAVPRASLLHSRIVARFESIEWWNPASGAGSCRATVCEHYAAWIEGEPRRKGMRGMAWVEVERETGHARVMGWLD
jgi:protein ImuB